MKQTMNRSPSEYQSVWLRLGNFFIEILTLTMPTPSGSCCSHYLVISIIIIIILYLYLLYLYYISISITIILTIFICVMFIFILCYIGISITIIFIIKLHGLHSVHNGAYCKGWFRSVVCRTVYPSRGCAVGLTAGLAESNGSLSPGL